MVKNRPLNWKVYNGEGELMGATHHAEDAAALVAIIGEDAAVKYGRLVVWNEGLEDFGASESYDAAAEIMCNRAGLEKQ